LRAEARSARRGFAGHAIAFTVTRLSIDPIVPDGGAIEEAARAIRAGGIVALPTDTLYGLAVDPFNAGALAAIRRLKERPADRAVPLVAADVGQIAATLGVLPILARLLAVRFWPGPLTMLMQAPERLPVDVTGGTGRVGVRVPAHAVARALCAACGTPLTATSANKSGQPATNDPETVAGSLGAGLDVLLDAGVTPGGPPSTIIDVTDATPRVIRQGAIPWESIQACLGL
jgi:L-threonylcarbamoyladenylate synthase